MKHVMFLFSFRGPMKSIKAQNTQQKQLNVVCNEHDETCRSGMVRCDFLWWAAVCEICEELRTSSCLDPCSSDRLYSRDIIQSLNSSQEAGLLLTQAAAFYLLWFLHNHSFSFRIWGGFFHRTFRDAEMMTSFCHIVGRFKPTLLLFIEMCQQREV